MSQKLCVVRGGRLAALAMILASGWGLRIGIGQQEPKSGEPTDPKAHRTFEQARDWERHGDKGAAMSAYRKADQQDGGNCQVCLSRAYFDADAIGAYKDAGEIAHLMLARPHGDKTQGVWHARFGIALQKEGIDKKKDQLFAQSADEFKTALALDSAYTIVHYSYGVTLAYLHQDDEARTQFQAFLDADHENPGLHERAGRIVENIELARSKMAPPFAVTTLDGQYVTMDSLAGKVVLIDFWATWCGPCMNALPHVRSIAHKFEGQPFVLLSVNLDADANKWRDFVAKQNMTWMQAHELGFGGPIAKAFSVTAIPSTFSIDADGVLRDEHVGDANIEGKLKKMIAQTTEQQRSAAARAALQPASNSQ